MTTVTDHKERLRELLADRRKATGATAAQLGPTLRSWVERGVPDNPIPRSLRMADDFMGWEPGSAAKVIEGGEPSKPGVRASPDLDQLEAVLMTALDQVRVWRRSTPPGRSTPAEGDQ